MATSFERSVAGPSGRASLQLKDRELFREQCLIDGRWLQPGQHLDLIGAFRPNMREVDDLTLTRAAIYVDTRAGATAEAGELVQTLASGVIKPSDIKGELSELVTGKAPARMDPSAITLFKSVGTAIEDLAAAELAVEGSAARSV